MLQRLQLDQQPVSHWYMLLSALRPAVCESTGALDWRWPSSTIKTETNERGSYVRLQTIGRDAKDTNGGLCSYTAYKMRGAEAQSGLRTKGAMAPTQCPSVVSDLKTGLAIEFTEP